MKHRIHCAEIWGGIDSIESGVCMPGLDATIFSQGAEVRGHGRNVKELSAWLYVILAEQMNSLDGAAILSGLNERVCDRGFQAISTAAVLSFNSMDKTLHFAYADHPPVLVRRAQSLWRPILLADTTGPANLPLGVMRRVQYDQGTIALAVGDRLGWRNARRQRPLRRPGQHR